MREQCEKLGSSVSATALYARASEPASSGMKYCRHIGAGEDFVPQMTHDPSRQPRNALLVKRETALELWRGQSPSVLWNSAEPSMLGGTLRRDFFPFVSSPAALEKSSRPWLRIH